MNNTLVFKNPLKGGANLTYDMTKVLIAQQRVSEIAFANPHRAPELMAMFVEASFDLGDILSDLQFQTFLAERKADERKAVLTVDSIPEIIKDKKLSQNAETRLALVDMDPEYQEAMIVLGSLKAGLVLVQQKLRAMEGALSSTKKTIDETKGSYLRGGNPNVGKAYDPTLDYEQTKTVVAEDSPIGIGKASYGGRKNG